MWVLIVVTVLGAVAATPVRIKNFLTMEPVPTNCPDGQRLDRTGRCREIWYDSDDQNHDASPRRLLTKRDGFRRIPNVIQVPKNCPEGQALDKTGQCREIWYDKDDQKPSSRRILSGHNGFRRIPNVIQVPPNCPEGQQLDQFAQCRVVWNDDDEKKQDKSRLGELGDADDQPGALNDEEFSKGVITVPNQCPNGYRADALGFCRKELPP